MKNTPALSNHLRHRVGCRPCPTGRRLCPYGRGHGAASLVLLWAALLWVALPGKAMAQDGGNLFAASLLSTLPSHHITCLAEDAQGYLWLGTPQGLARYSGGGLRTFTHHEDVTSLPDDAVTALCTDSAGTLWVGTNRGLCAIRQGRVETFHPPVEDFVSTLTDQDHGQLLLGGYRGLFTVDKASGQATLRASHADVCAAFRLLATPRGHVYVVPEHRRKLIILGKDYRTIHQEEMPAGVVVNNLALSQPAGDAVYVATTQGLLICQDADMQDEAPAAFLTQTTQGADVAFVCTHEGRICVGVVGQGIYLYDEQTNQIVPIPTSTTLRAGEEYQALLTPQDLWLSSGHGLPQRIPLTQQRDQTIPIPDLWRDEFIWEILPEEGDNFFLKSTYHLFYIDAAAMTCHDITPAAIVGRQIDRTVAYSSRLGQVALSTDQEVLQVYDWADGVLSRPRRYPVGAFSCIWFDAEGNLYAHHGDRLSIITPTGERTQQYLAPSIDLQLSLPAVGGDSYLVDGTWTNLYTIDDQQRPTLLWTAPAAGLSSVCRQSNSRLWVGTYYQGAYCLDSLGHIVDHIANIGGAENPFVAQIACDAEGNLWLVTDRHVMRVSASDGTHTTFHNPNEVNTTTSPTFRTAVVHNGTIYFGSAHALTRMRPAEALPGQHIPLALDALLVNGRAVALGRETIVLDHDDNNLTLCYSALSFAPDAQFNYAVCLEGYDNGFRPMGQTTHVSYDKLRPGTYTFRVRVCSPGGDWSDQELVQKLVVGHNRWMTPVRVCVYLAVILLLMAAGVGYAAIRHRKHRALRRLYREAMEEKERHLRALAAKASPVGSGPAGENGPGDTDEASGPDEAGQVAGSDDVPAPPVSSPAASSAVEEPAEEVADSVAPTSSESPQAPALSHADRRFLERVYRLMDEHLSEETFNVTSLAQELGMSRSSFYTRMKALTGQSTQSLLTNYRLDRARQLLQEHELNISEVCYRVGFGSLSGFSRSFKKRFGVAPSAV